MKKYININTLEYPFSEADIKSRYKDISWPVRFVPPSEYKEVKDAPIPFYDKLTTRVFETAPTLINGEWVKTWEFKSLSAEEKAELKALTLRSTKNQLASNVQARLDNFARSNGYNDIASACSYALSTVEKFKIEGQYCVRVRDEHWVKLFEIFTEIERGQRPVDVTYAIIESEFSDLQWPAVG